MLKVKHYKSTTPDDYGQAKVREYWGSRNSTFSLAFVKYTGRFPETGYIKNNDCNETYFIVEGKFEVEVKGDKTYKLETFDSIFVPKGTVYAVKGKGRLVSINDPSWCQEQFEMI